MTERPAYRQDNKLTDIKTERQKLKKRKKEPVEEVRKDNLKGIEMGKGIKLNRLLIHFF